MESTLIDIAVAAREAARILIVAHIQPDGDTLGSCFALQNMLSRLGKTAHICCDGDVPHRYVDLFPSGVMKKPAVITGEYDLSIALDCADSARIGKALGSFKKGKRTVNIDHHMTNDRYADMNFVQQASSVGEIVFDMMRVAGIEQDELSAKYLYIAISTDTGNFTYSNTSKACMAAAAELVELFNLSDTADVLFRRRTLTSTQLIGRALASLETHQEGRIAFLTITMQDMKQLGATGGDCEDIVNFAREIEQTKAAVFFRELPAGVKVSLRSKGDIDVGKIAMLLGGGGHKNAAGCNIGGKMDEVKKQILSCLMEIV